MLIRDGEMPAWHRWQLGSVCHQPGMKPLGFRGSRFLGILCQAAGASRRGAPLQLCPDVGAGWSSQHKRATNHVGADASWELTTALGLVRPLHALAAASCTDNAFGGGF